MYIGALENNQKRNLISPSRLSNILANFETYVKILQPLTHPTHLTPEERIMRNKKRAKKRRQKPK
jgi:hypothetical protein